MPNYKIFYNASLLIMRLISKNLGADFYFVYLIIFFVLNGWNNFFEIISIIAILKLLLWLLTGAWICFYLSFLGFKNKDKSGLFTLFAFYLILFFDSVNRTLSYIFNYEFRIEIQFFYICFFLLLIILFLSRIKIISRKFINFVNALTIILVLFECIRLSLGILNKKSFSSDSFVNKKMTYAESSKLPSVYLIVLDEYSGAESLQKEYGFSNSLFLDSLTGIGFKILLNAKSNYRHTMLSIPSILNGEYLIFPKGQPPYSEKGYRYALDKIYSNKVTRTFIRLGYKSTCYSPFLIEGNVPSYNTRFLPTGYMLILYPTLIDDFCELFPSYVRKKICGLQTLSRYYMKGMTVNYDLIDKVLQQSADKKNEPKFIYLHLMMPHAPYAMDSLGGININFLSTNNPTKEQKKEAYLQYLKYSNKVMTKFLKQLISNTNGEAVILLMSDHGSRELVSQGRDSAVFNSLNAVFYKGLSHVNWYNGMSNVNEFRILFSNISGSVIPLLKDSTISY